MLLFTSSIDMTRIGLISDTHGYLDPAVFEHFKQCDEVWHAGDFGSIQLATSLRQLLPGNCKFRGVYGNIDGSDTRAIYPEQLVFQCEDVKVMIRHIGGAPPNYNPETRKQFELHHPNLFVSGHSHILKVMYDQRFACLHMNPGAAGKQGWHKVRTLIRFAIDGNNMKDCEVIELGKRN
jgi:putative phosphoesterase